MMAEISSECIFCRMGGGEESCGKICEDEHNLRLRRPSRTWIAWPRD